MGTTAPAEPQIRALAVLTPEERTALILAARGNPARVIARALGWKNVTYPHGIHDPETGERVETERRSRPGLEEDVEKALARIRARVEVAARRWAGVRREELQPMAEEKNGAPEAPTALEELAAPMRAALEALDRERQALEEKLAGVRSRRRRVEAALDALQADGDGEEEKKPDEPDPGERDKLDEKDQEQDAPAEAPLREKAEANGRRESLPSPEVLLTTLRARFRPGRLFQAVEALELLGLPDNRATRKLLTERLRRLVEEGHLRKHGERRSTRYEVVRSPAEKAEKPKKVRKAAADKRAADLAREMRDYIVANYRDGRPFRPGEVAKAVGSHTSDPAFGEARRALEGRVFRAEGQGAGRRWRYIRHVDDPAGARRASRGKGLPDRVTGSEAPVRGRPIASTGHAARSVSRTLG